MASELIPIGFPPPLERSGVLGTQPSPLYSPWVPLCPWVPQVTVRVKVEEVAPGEAEDTEAVGDPPSPPSESPQLPSGDGWREEVAWGKVKFVPEEEEQRLQETGNGLKERDPSRATPTTTPKKKG